MKDQEFWHSKHPLATQMYSGRPLPNGKSYEMDVRHFIWAGDLTLEKILRDNDLIGGTHDETAGNIQKYVVKFLKYVSDETLGRSEYWLFPKETIELGQGDCEDGAILIASLLLTALPESERWRVRMAAGLVQSAPTAPEGGHGWCDYIRCKDNECVILDWCYMQDSGVPVHKKKLAKENKPYETTWFSFNHKYAWSHMNFELRGRLNV